MKKLILFFLIILFTGCATNSSTSLNLPSWYINTPQSNNLFYYGVGEGDSKSAAKADALNQIASQISTTISSNLNIKQNSISINGKTLTSSNIAQNIKAEVSKIHFNNVKIKKLKYLNGKFIVLVEVNREKLFKVYKNEIDNLCNKLKTLYKLSKNNFIVYLRNKERINKIVNTLMAKLALLQSIKPDFDIQSYYNKINKIQSSLKEAVSNTKVSVKIDNKDAINYKRVIEKYLSKLGLKIVKKSDFKIILNIKAHPKKVEIRDPRLKGVKWAYVNIDIIVKYKGEIISTNSLSVINGSRNSYHQAVMKAKKFEKKIDEIGIVNILVGN